MSAFSFLNPNAFIRQIFEEHKANPSTLYSKLDDPYQSETHDTFGSEVFRRPTSAYKVVCLGNDIRVSCEEENFKSASLDSIVSPTFQTNATEFLKKVNFDESQEEPTDGAIIGQYVLGDIIGTGAFSTVRRGNLVSDPSVEVAIKITNKNSYDKSLLQSVYNEIMIWKELNHPNVVKFIDVIETQTFIYVICELCSQSLLDYITEKEEGLTEKEAKRIFQQLLDAIEYLHKNELIHRDIKLDNILMDANLNAKITDFGFSESTLDPEKSSPSGLNFEIGGTLHYSPPEVLRGNGTLAVGKKSDIWSLGVTLFAMVTGEMPFDNDFAPRLQQDILCGKFCFSDEHQTCLTKDVQLLVKGMLTVDVQLRSSLECIKTNPWLCGCPSSP